MRMKKTIPVGISNRHFHLSRHDLDRLFGVGYELSKLRDITQIGQFAAQETLDVIGPSGTITGVRIVGPLRERTQLELAASDAHVLGISPPVRYSGDLDGSACVRLRGPAGEIDLHEGVIIPIRHLHLSPQDAREFGLSNGARVRIAPAQRPQFDTRNEPRPIVFDNVLVRVSPTFVAEFHIDIDEANASGLRNGDPVRIIGLSELDRMARKSVITEREVREAIRRGTRIRAAAGTLITPAAKDLAREHGILDE